MTRFFTILLILVSAFCSVLGQQNSLNLTGNYSIFHHSDFVNKWEGGGLNFGYQRALNDHFSAGLGVNWLLFESSRESLEHPVNPIYPAVKYSLIAVKPTLFYYFGKPFKGFYCGAALSYDYLTSRTELDDSNPYYIYFPENDSGAGVGLLYGYRYQFPSGFGLLVQGSHDWSSFDNNGIASPLHQWGAGAFVAF